MTADGLAAGHLPLVDHLSVVFGDEAFDRDSRAAVPWPVLPDVQAVIAHVGRVQRWVTAVVRTRRAVPDDAVPPVPPTRSWYDDGRMALLDALAAVAPEERCWILGDRIGTAGFWTRRMVHEHAKHLMDVRASDGGDWVAAPELTPDDYADGIDEMWSEFLPRFRSKLPPLPGPVVLTATDTARTWRVERDWSVDAGSTAGFHADAEVLARTQDLALALWERADVGRTPDRFRIVGSEGAALALLRARIHPW